MEDEDNSATGGWRRRLQSGGETLPFMKRDRKLRQGKHEKRVISKDARTITSNEDLNGSVWKVMVDGIVFQLIIVAITTSAEAMITVAIRKEIPVSVRTFFICSTLFTITLVVGLAVIYRSQTHLRTLFALIMVIAMITGDFQKEVPLLVMIWLSCYTMVVYVTAIYRSDTPLHTSLELISMVIATAAGKMITEALSKMISVSDGTLLICYTLLNITVVVCLAVIHWSQAHLRTFMSPSATVSSRAKDQRTEQHYDPEKPHMKLADQELQSSERKRRIEHDTDGEPPIKVTEQKQCPLASETFAKRSFERKRKIKHDTNVVATTSTSPSDSLEAPTDLQMQEKQPCSDVDLSASAVASPAAAVSSREEDQQTEQHYNPVASPTATAGSREGGQQTEQQHNPVVGSTSTSPNDSPEKPTNPLMQEKQSCSDDDLNAPTVVDTTSTSPSNSLENLNGLQMQEKQSCIDADLSVSAGGKGIGELKSKEVEKYIGQSGGFIEIDGCKVTIPAGACRTEAKVKVFADAGFRSFDDGFAVSPALHCNADGITKFLKPVTVELPTWLVPTDDIGSPLFVMRWNDQQDKEGGRITNVSFNSEGKIIFETDQFSIFRAFLARLFGFRIKVIPSLFLHNNGQYAATFHLKNETTAREIANMFPENKYTKPCELSPILAKPTEDISFELKSTMPDGITFEEQKGGARKVTMEYVIDAGYAIYNFTSTSKKRATSTLKYMIKPGRGQYVNSETFIPASWPDVPDAEKTHDANDGKEAPSSKATPEHIIQVNIQNNSGEGTNVQHKTVNTANNLALGNSQIDVKNDGTTYFAGSPK